MNLNQEVVDMNHLLEQAEGILNMYLLLPIPPPILDDSDEELTDDDYDNEDEDEDLPLVLNEEEEHVRISDYVVNVVYYYTDRDFRSHFRLSRTGIEELYLEIQDMNVVEVQTKPPVPLTHALLLSIWILATKEAFRSAADRFGFDRGHAHVMCMKIWQKMFELRSTWIRWPRGAAAEQCLQDFNERGIPGVFGVVDGCHIEIPGPKNDNSYYNRKGYHSILLQGVCDSHLRFIDIFCGFPGSVHDARVWAHSPLGQALALNHEAHLPPDSFILCDSAYSCRPYSIPPFKNDGHLTQQMINFNKKISRVRVIIENAFGRLKGIFRRMQYLHITNLNYGRYYITAACILHNLVIKERFELGDIIFDEVLEEEDVDNVIQDDDDLLIPDVAVGNETGAQRRVRLMNVIEPL